MTEQDFKTIVVIVFIGWLVRFLYLYSPWNLRAKGENAYWMDIPSNANPYSGIFGSWWLDGWIVAYKRHVHNQKAIIKSRGQEAYFQEIPLELNPYYGDEGWYWFDGWLEGRKKASESKTPLLRNPDIVF